MSSALVLTLALLGAASEAPPPPPPRASALDASRFRLLTEEDAPASPLASVVASVLVTLLGPTLGVGLGIAGQPWAGLAIGTVLATLGPGLGDLLNGDPARAFSRAAIRLAVLVGGLVLGGGLIFASLATAAPGSLHGPTVGIMIGFVLGLGGGVAFSVLTAFELADADAAPARWAERENRRLGERAGDADGLGVHLRPRPFIAAPSCPRKAKPGSESPPPGPGAARSEDRATCRSERRCR